jgi:hypothetical protein
MKSILAALAFCITNVFVQAQTHFVVGSGGGQLTSANGTLEWTLGEISTETYQKRSGLLTQGFHQTFAEETPSTRIVVYPNPVPQDEFLYIKTPKPGSYRIELFNLLGKKLISNEGSISQDNLYSLDVQHLEAALYLLRVKNMTTGRLFTFKIILL